MAGTFLGKWTILGLGPKVNGVILGYLGFLSYMDRYKPKLYSPPDWTPPLPFPTHVAFILRDDGVVCLQLNNGRYIGYPGYGVPLTYIDMLDYAQGFTFETEGFGIFFPLDPKSLPTSFEGQITGKPAASRWGSGAPAAYIGTDNFGAYGDGSVIWISSPETQGQPPRFALGQVTPPIDALTGTGDGLDYAWVDFTGSDMGTVSSFRNADFSHARFPSSPIQIEGRDFTGANFSNSNLQGSFLYNCSLSKADLTNSNLSGAIFNLTGMAGGGTQTIQPCDFSSANITNADLTSATLTYCWLLNTTISNSNLTGADLTGANLSGAHVNSNLTGANFTDANLSGANLAGSTFAGTNLSQANVIGAIFTGDDLTTVIASPLPLFYNTPLSQPSATNPLTTLARCRLNQSLLGSDWSMLDLTGATILNLSSPLSSHDNPLQAKYSILTGLNGNNLVGLSLESAVFDNAIMDGLNLNTEGTQVCDLTGASFIDASLHGVDFTGAILKGANLTGAQLGTLRRLFTLPASAQDALNTGQTSALLPLFSQNAITLSANATLNTAATNRVWTLIDTGNNITYTIRLETQADKTQALVVYKPATAASLVDAYMPAAILTGANLYGIVASGVQFYGGGAMIDGSAILEEAQLNDSNLGNVNFTEAQMQGVNLSGSHLFNAKFNGANLTPSAQGASANLSRANLQGVDFTDAQLYGANLTNAAVAISIPTKGNPNQGGVYLFSLPSEGDARTLEQYVSELTAASTQFIIKTDAHKPLSKYLDDLRTGRIADFIIAFEMQSPPRSLSPSATIKTITEGSVWQIQSQTADYTLWTAVDNTGQTQLHCAPSLSILPAAFQQNQYTLRLQAGFSMDQPGQLWLIDNDSQNPDNFDLGYVRFAVKLNGNELEVYGLAVRIERLGDNDQLQIDTETCNITKLAESNMSNDTICPNQTTLGVNKERGGSWEQWMRADALPNPPTCVPTDNSYCSPSHARASTTANPGS